MNWLDRALVVIGALVMWLVVLALEKEYDAWSRDVATWVIRAAVLFLPYSRRERCRQEWLAELEEAHRQGKALTFALFDVMLPVPFVAARWFCRDTEWSAALGSGLAYGLGLGVGAVVAALGAWLGAIVDGAHVATLGVALGIGVGIRVAVVIGGQKVPKTIEFGALLGAVLGFQLGVVLGIGLGGPGALIGALTGPVLGGVLVASVAAVLDVWLRADLGAELHVMRSARS